MSASDEPITTATAISSWSLHDALKSGRMTRSDLQVSIEADPEALQRKDEDGRLPLHIACGAQQVIGGFNFIHYGDPQEFDVIKTIFDAFPDAVREVDNLGRTALHVSLHHRDREGEHSAEKIVLFLLEA